MSHPTHRKRSPEEWQRLIEQQAHSGQSQVTFCADNDLSKTTFQHWKRRLKAKSSASPSLSSSAAMFTPLLEAGSGPTTGTDSARGWDIELDLGADICLRIRRNS